MVELSDERLAAVDEAPTRKRYVVVGALCAVAMVAYVQRNSIGVAEEAIREELQLSKEAMGWVMSAFFLTYALFQLPTGWLAQRLGTRQGMSVFAIVYSAAAGLFAFAWGLPMLIAARLGMGAAQSGIFPCAVNSIAKWMPDRRRSLASGLLGSFMSVGGAVGAALMGILLQYSNWRWASALFALPGFALAGWYLLRFHDEPRDHPDVNRAELDLIRDAGPPPVSAQTPEEPTPWGEMLSSVPVLALCGQQVFRAVGYIFFATWFATYLRETRGVGDLKVGLLTSLPLLGVVVGCPLGGAVSDWVFHRTGDRRLSRQGVAAASMACCGGLILLSHPVQDATAAVLLISAGSFIASFAGPCAYTATIDMGGRHVTMLFSLMNMAGNVGAFVFPIVVPYLIQKDPGRPGSGNWDLVLYTFAGMYFAAAVCWLLANPQATVSGVVQPSAADKS